MKWHKSGLSQPTALQYFNGKMVPFITKNNLILKFSLAIICLRFKKLKHNYLAKTPLEKWHFIRQINYKLLKVVGVQIMRSDYKVHAKTFIGVYLVLNYYILMVYTWYYYRNDLFRALISTPALGTFVPVSN